MYEIDQGWWFVPNPLNKFTVSPRNNLKINPDGSLTLYFQNEVAGQGQGSQLAARAERRVHPDAAHVLAEGEGAVDSRRHLEAADDPEGELKQQEPCIQRDVGCRVCLLAFLPRIYEQPVVLEAKPSPEVTTCHLSVSF